MEVRPQKHKVGNKHVRELAGNSKSYYKFWQVLNQSALCISHESLIEKYESLNFKQPYF